MGEEKPQAFYQQELDALATEFPDQIALCITEPYLGAAGSYHPPTWYHQMLQKWCEDIGAAFIFDEVQACHGRTGNMYAFESYECQPDLVVLGKGLGNGEPAAAVVGRADLIDSFTWGEASDTFSGTPRACAAVCATLDVFEEQNVVENCRAMAPKVRAGFERLQKQFPFIQDIRGEGLVYGIDIVDAETANRCVMEAYNGADEGVGVHFLGPLSKKVLRVSPPLVITEDELNEGLAVLDKAWARV
jgi:4-aminobutyrate aminotransferase-like enzyme